MTSAIERMLEQARGMEGGHVLEERLEQADEAASILPDPSLPEYRQNPPTGYALGDRYQLGKLSITHERIIEWLVANPGRGQMGKCALYFGITRSWLSTLVHSDAFQALLKERLDDEYQLTVVPLREKMVGVAHRAVDKLGEAIEGANDVKTLADTADKLLHRLGYAPKTSESPGGSQVNNTQNNFYAVSPALLAAARDNAKKGGLSNATNSGTPEGLPAPEGVQALPGDTLGEVGEASAVVLTEEKKDAPWGEENGGDL